MGYHWLYYSGYGWSPAYYYAAYTADWDADGFQEYYQASSGWYGVYYIP